MLREALLRLRSELGYSQTELAQALNVSFATINRWENKRVIPNSHIAEMVMDTVQNMNVSSSCIEYLEHALFSGEKDNETEKLHRLDMNMAGQLVDGSTTGIFVADRSTYELLYLNETMEEFCARANVKHCGMTCYGYIHGRTSPCPNCHLERLSENTFIEQEYLSQSGSHYLMRGKYIMWEDKEAHVEYISDESEALAKQSIVRDLSDRVPGGLGIYDVYSDGWIKLSYASADYYVVDTGVGMREEAIKNLLNSTVAPDMGESNRMSNTGHGFSIAKSLVEAMGGNISIQSRIGIGTTVSLHLQFEVVGEIPVIEESVTSYDLDVLSGKKILLAEDHPLNATIAERLLERKNMIVKVADNGQKAVEIFEASSEGEYAAILMDIRMPVMDGLEAAKCIRNMPRSDAKTIPIIAVTANAYDEDKERTRMAGMDAHLAKPVEPNLMYEALARSITKHKEEEK